MTMKKPRENPIVM